jgi:hypothetical protein
VLFALAAHWLACAGSSVKLLLLLMLQLMMICTPPSACSTTRDCFLISDTIRFALHMNATHLWGQYAPQTVHLLQGCPPHYPRISCVVIKQDMQITAHASRMCLWCIAACVKDQWPTRLVDSLGV